MIDEKISCGGIYEEQIAENIEDVTQDLKKFKKGTVVRCFPPPPHQQLIDPCTGEDYKGKTSV